MKVIVMIKAFIIYNQMIEINFLIHLKTILMKEYKDYQVVIIQIILNVLIIIHFTWKQMFIKIEELTGSLVTNVKRLVIRH